MAEVAGKLGYMKCNANTERQPATAKRSRLRSGHPHPHRILGQFQKSAKIGSVPSCGLGFYSTGHQPPQVRPQAISPLSQSHVNKTVGRSGSSDRSKQQQQTQKKEEVPSTCRFRVTSACVAQCAAPDDVWPLPRRQKKRHLLLLNLRGALIAITPLPILQV